MLKKFEEYVNEGLISDFQKKQEEVSSSVLSEENKQFIIEFLRKMNSVNFPCICYFSNCSVSSIGLSKFMMKEYNFNVDNYDKYKSIEHIKDSFVEEIKIKRNDIIEFSEKFEKNKVLNNAILKWFNEKFDTWKEEHPIKVAKSDGKVYEKPNKFMRVGFLLDYKDEIIDEIF